jgi:hypothetical protein
MGGGVAGTKKGGRKVGEILYVIRRKKDKRKVENKRE